MEVGLLTRCVHSESGNVELELCTCIDNALRVTRFQ
jgi:hypothetical protein